MLSLKKARSYLPELQTAELQSHAFADLAGIALHVVVPELMGERPRVRLRPSVFLPRAQAQGGGWVRRCSLVRGGITEGRF